MTLPPDEEVVSLVVTPEPGTVWVDDTIQFTATGTYADAHTADITGLCDWRTDNSNATFEETGTDGLALGVTHGYCYVTASYQNPSSGGGVLPAPIEDAATLNVNYVIITITPDPATLVAEEALQLTATGEFKDHTEDITHFWYAWSSDDPTVATVGNGLHAGKVIGIAVGSCEISFLYTQNPDFYWAVVSG